jgi:hypothetical protein
MRGASSNFAKSDLTFEGSRVSEERFEIGPMVDSRIMLGKGMNMNKFAKLSGFALAYALVACGGGSSSEYDAALLEQYRTAIPKESQLSASAPQASIQAIVGDPALLPKGSKDIVFGINGSVGGIIDTMKTIVATEPTIYKSDTKEFVWGPFPNDDGVGTVAAYIKDQGEGAEFRYAYALLRGMDQDLAKMSPVIWGGASPDPNTEDHGKQQTIRTPPICPSIAGVS